jgi:hypothetical protein
MIGSSFCGRSGSDYEKDYTLISQVYIQQSKIFIVNQRITKVQFKNTSSIFWNVTLFRPIFATPKTSNCFRETGRGIAHLFNF